MRHVPMIVFLAVSVPSLLACSGLGSKTKDCNAFITAVNGALPGIQAITQEQPGADIGKITDQMKRIGDAYSTLHDTLAAIQITDEGLKPKVDEYVRMTDKMADVSHKTAAGAAHLDMGALTKAQRQMGDLANDESRLVDDINTYCGAK